MDQPHLEILREASGKRQRKETIERALGKAVRNRGLDFSVYIQMMSEIREFARKHRISELDAVEQLLEEGDDKA